MNAFNIEQEEIEQSIGVITLACSGSSIINFKKKYGTEGAKMFGTKESVVIVEAKGCGKYSKQLYTLIGANDDDGENIVGPVDGSVEASVFDEKRFAATPLSSDQKIIFIGHPKTAKDYVDAIETEATTKIVEHGISICISGKQACVYVDEKNLSDDGYREFLEYAHECGQDLDNLLSELRPRSEPENEQKKIAPLWLAGKVADDAGSKITLVKKGGDIKDQKYRFAVKLLYLEHLRSFVEA